MDTYHPKPNDIYQLKCGELNWKLVSPVLLKLITNYYFLLFGQKITRKESRYNNYERMDMKQNIVLDLKPDNGSIDVYKTNSTNNYQT